MRRIESFGQAALIVVIGAMVGYFFIAAANAGVLALASVFWFMIAAGLLFHFGAKAWQFLYIHAPLLIGVAIGYWVALGAVVPWR
jgi:hypothetical protein